MLRNCDTINIFFITSIGGLSIVLISFLLSILSNNLREVCILSFRIIISLSIGFVIIVNNFDYGWERAQLQTKIPYHFESNERYTAQLTLKVGLQGVLIYSTRLCKNESSIFGNKIIWDWVKENANIVQLQQNHCDSTEDTPLEIQWILDYFRMDAGRFRFKQFYSMSGWFCYITLWTAFAFWLIANLVIRSVISYGALLLGCVGFLQLLTNLIWKCVANHIDLNIPFEDGFMSTSYGYNFWLSFYMGLFCLFLSILIILLDLKYVDALYIMMGMNPLDNYDELVYLKKEEIEAMSNIKNTNSIPLSNFSSGSAGSKASNEKLLPVYMRRSIIHGSVLSQPRLTSNYCNYNSRGDIQSDY